MNKKKARIIAEIILAILFLIVIIHLLQEHAPKIMKMLTSGNAKEIDSYLEQYGTEGKILLVLLQVIETVSIVLPSTPVYICSGIMFGKLLGVVVCYVTNLVLNLIIFLVACGLNKAGRQNPEHRKLGAGNKKLGTVEHMIANAKHMDRVVLAMCLLPIVPNGMIPYLSAKTEISAPDFMKALAVGSLPSIVVYVCCGDILVSDSWKIMIPIIIVLVVISAIAFAFRKKLTAVVEPKLKSFLEG